MTSRPDTDTSMLSSEIVIQDMQIDIEDANSENPNPKVLFWKNYHMDQ
jgi:hypothetical protein